MRAFPSAAALLAALVLAGCGGSGGKGQPQPAPGPKLPAPQQFLSVDAAAHEVTIRLIAGYDDANSGFNFDGYSRELLFVVPKGWTVHVVCKNRAGLRHSCAVVRGSVSSRLAFPGASTPQPAVGLGTGETAEFTFEATKTGVYRFTCLVSGHEAAGMWDPLKIVPHGKPAVADLRARA